jgi:LysR family transcriptional regulator, glycine cleavage system transcriptional activator
MSTAKGHFFSLANMSLEAALKDQGVSMGRGTLVKDLLESGQLVTPLKKKIKSPTQYCLVYHHELARLPELQAVTHWLREQATVA